MTATPNNEKATPQTGNVNPQMGEANKKMMAERLSDKNDPLTLEVIKLVSPNAVEVISCCTLRSKEDTQLRNSEIAFIYSSIDENGKEIQGEICVDTKGSMGFGSLNQLAIFWLSNVLDEKELATPAGKALTHLAGASKADDNIVPYVYKDLMAGDNYSKYGMPLQTWLGEDNNLSKFLTKGLGVKPGELGKKVLLLNMRQAGDNKEDLFVMVDAGALGQAAIKEATLETSKKQKYVKVYPTETSLSFSRAISLKRVGGPIRGVAANQLQLIVKAKGLVDMMINPQPNNKLAYTICTETPRAQSLAISKLNDNFDEHQVDELSSNMSKMLKQISLVAVDLNEGTHQNKKSMHKK